MDNSPLAESGLLHMKLTLVIGGQSSQPQDGGPKGWVLDPTIISGLHSTWRMHSVQLPSTSQEMKMHVVTFKQSHHPDPSNPLSCHPIHHTVHSRQYQGIVPTFWYSQQKGHQVLIKDILIAPARCPSQGHQTLLQVTHHHDLEIYLSTFNSTQFKPWNFLL